jgi:hypothetical protein
MLGEMLEPTQRAIARRRPGSIRRGSEHVLRERAQRFFIDGVQVIAQRSWPARGCAGRRLAILRVEAEDTTDRRL